MSKNPDTVSWTERLKSVPRSFVAYKKDCIAAIDETKKERKLLAPLVFTALLFLSCIFLIGAHFRGVDYYIDNTESFLNDFGLLKNTTVFSVGTTLLFGLIFFAILFIVYVFTRFACVMLFSRGSGLKGKDVLLDGILEFGMNAIPLIIFFLIGGVLSDLVWWSFYPLFIFFALFFIIMLFRSIFDAVDRKKQASLMVFVAAVCIFISLALILGFLIAVMSYSLITIAQGVYDNIINYLLENIVTWLGVIFGGMILS